MYLLNLLHLLLTNGLVSVFVSSAVFFTEVSKLYAVRNGSYFFNRTVSQSMFAL